MKSMEIHQETKDKRYSIDNWKVLQDLKEERKRLKEFKESQEAASTIETQEGRNHLDVTTQSEESFLSSCSHKTCRHLITGVEKLDTETSMKVETQEESNTARRVNVEPDITSYDRLQRERMEDQDLNCIKYQDTVPEMLQRGSPYQSSDTLSELLHHKAVPFISLNIPQTVTCTLAALFEVKKFFNYMKGQRRLLGNTDGSFDSQNNILRILTEVTHQVYLEKSRDLSALHRALAEMSRMVAITSCPEFLESLFQCVHKLLVEGKQNKSLTKRCMPGCKQKCHSNHSIISHLFRGYFRRQAHCSCGHLSMHHEIFSALELPQPSLDWRNIVVCYFNVEKEKLTRYLMQINNWTTYRGLIDRIAKYIGKDVKELILAAVKDNVVATIKDKVALINESDDAGYQLWVFDCLDVSTKATKDAIRPIVPNNDEYPFTSTPAESEGSDEEERISDILSVGDIKRKRVVVAISLEIPDSSGDDALTKLPLVCRSQSVVKLHQILQAVECSLEKKVDWRTAFIYGTDIEITVTNDISLSLGIPSKSLLLEEMVNAFLTRTQQYTCSKCSAKEERPTETKIIKYPEVLVLKFDKRNVGKTPLIVNDTITPGFSRWAGRKRYYRLVALITDDKGDRTLTVRKKGIGAWMKVRKDEGATACNNPPEFGAELALYCRNDAPRSYRRRSVLDRDNGSKRSSSYSAMIRRKSVKRLTEGDVISNHRDTMPTEGTTGDVVMETQSNDGASSCTCTRCQCIEDMARKIKQVDEPRSASWDDDAYYQSLGSNLNYKDGNSSPAQLVKKLHQCVLRQDVRKTIHYLEEGAKPDILINGVSAIHLAAGMAPPMGYIFTRLLLERGCNPNVETDEGYTPLGLATMWHREETIRLLVANGGLHHKPSQERSSISPQSEIMWLSESAIDDDMNSTDQQGMMGETNSGTQLLDVNGGSFKERHDSLNASTASVPLTTLIEESIEEIEYNPRSFLKTNCSSKVFCCSPSFTDRIRHRFRTSPAFRRFLSYVFRPSRHDV